MTRVLRGKTLGIVGLGYVGPPRGKDRQGHGPNNSIVRRDGV